MAGRIRDTRPIVDPYLEREADHVAMAHQRKGFVGKGPKNYTSKTDQKTKELVCDVLTGSYDIDASEIDVQVENGVVYLRGEVDTREMKRLAENAVDGVYGVTDIMNQLTYKEDRPVVHRQYSNREYPGLL